ncbi:MAG: hypothetical protein CM15mV25_0310 [uncultured marine virus]|nr:MAG: hypothetical protein CM15mV25_0310 [uncultured marine virus]
MPRRFSNKFTHLVDNLKYMIDFHSEYLMIVLKLLKMTFMMYNKFQMYDKFRDGENLYFDLDVII